MGTGGARQKNKASWQLTMRLKNNLATTYSPRGQRPKYHRLRRA
ncbi:hypothetical protein Psch_00057 [Pelotomaculum schinkii]|uniref:Uncharacterized protein n=1 Tax=Pelotomaculum schinkii TaxID=78350 RepID=A0A4Y7RBY1_9FIRM|nr:hypothetical protein Psch_00057 [Pelotomaculum schinkii]